MSAADLADRAARRSDAVHASLWILPTVLLLVMMVVVYQAGKRVGVRDEQVRALAAQLDTNAHAVTHATAHANTTRATAAVAVVQSATHRADTRRAQAPITITSDSTVAISTLSSASARDSALRVIEHDTIPPLVVAELRADRAQITQDSLTIAALGEHVASLDSLLHLKDQRIGLLEQEVHALRPPRFGFRSGLVVGVVTVAALALFAP